MLLIGVGRPIHHHIVSIFVSVRSVCIFLSAYDIVFANLFTPLPHSLSSPVHTELDELRRKFEEDKARIAKMKADRKFRPF